MTATVVDMVAALDCEFSKNKQIRQSQKNFMLVSRDA